MFREEKKKMRNAAVNFKNYIMRKEAEALALIYAPKLKKQGSAIVAEIILIVVVIALAVALWTVKKKGVGNFVSCMVALVLLMAMMIFSVTTYANLNLAIKKSRIERSFMLQMEAEGYLSLSARDALTQQLTDMGVEQISFAGTTLSPAGYGNIVTLSVTGRIKMTNIVGMKNLFEFIRGDDTSDFKIYQKSTAKY